MTVQTWNRISRRVLLGLSAIALGLVVAGLFQPPQQDEGAMAHIFQLAIVALVPTGLLYLATSDLRRPLASLRPLVEPAFLVGLAFILLVYLERGR